MCRRGTAISDIGGRLGAIVAQIHDHAALLPMVTDQARRHIGCSALLAHYDRLGEALVWTIDQKLGEESTPSTRDALTKAYRALSAAIVSTAGYDGAAGLPT